MSVDTATAADTTAAENVEVPEDGTVVDSKVTTISEGVAEFMSTVRAMIDADVSVFADKDNDETVAVRRLFGALDKDGKRQVRGFIRDEIATLLAEQGDISAQLASDPSLATELVAVAQKSAGWNSLKDHGLRALSAPTTSAPRKVVDPLVAIAENVAQIQLAYALAISDLPEGIDADALNAKVAELVTEDSQAQAAEYRAFIENGQDGTEPEFSQTVKAAARISLGRGPKGQGRKPGKGKTTEIQTDETTDDDAAAE